MSEFETAMDKYGSASNVILNVSLENVEIGTAMRLIATMAKEVAEAEKKRQEAAK